MPGGSSPAVLNVHGEALGGEMWGKMWFYEYARGLMRDYSKNSADKDVGEGMIELRDSERKWIGGRFGAWTGDGKWLQWSEVCGNFQDALFPDGNGTFPSEEDVNNITPSPNTSYEPNYENQNPLSQKPAPNIEESHPFQPTSESNSQQTDRFIVKTRKGKAKHVLEELVENGEGEEKGERRKGLLDPEELRGLPGWVDVRFDDLLEAPALVNL
ncbi:hypothetical protein M7I_6323 [Glarea lozoyensis 74030]|nr:hypothetical protein M7I_6323 [Glarea lozoyensis 74030]